jgi:hypothetical protein
MSSIKSSMWLTAFIILANALPSAADEGTPQRKIVLVAGETAKVDKIGHHDYLAGCECLKFLLEQSEDIKAIRVNDGWPADERVFDGASSIVFYTDGGGKQAFLKSPARIAKLQSLIDSGVGVVMIHQAIDYPDKYAEQAKSWLGGIYRSGKSGRGHWPSSHIDFPSHAITRGVSPWKINDGWLNGLEFVAEMQGVTPLVWSGKEVEESRAGVDAHIVGWAYERPDGGRSFSFSGLDAHSAWSLVGMRQLVVNGVLWSARAKIPEHGAASVIREERLEAMQTPRTPKK